MENYLKNLVVYIMLVPGFVGGLVTVIALVYWLALLVGMDPLFIEKWINE